MTAPLSLQLGALRIDVVSDGYFLMDGGAIFGIVPRTMWEPHAGPPDPLNRLRIPLNCLLVRDGSRTALIDTGVGQKIPAERRERAYPGDYGSLLTGLAAIDVRPADIDLVVNTHLHFDHCGWNTSLVHGRPIPTFPNARYAVQRAEWDAFAAPDERTRATYLAENMTALADAALLDLLDGESQLMPWLRVLPAPGHSAGHAAVVLSSGGETAIYLGDVVQHPSQIDRPAWVSAFDLLPLVSMATKKRLVEEAWATGAMLITTHAPYPGIGRIVDEDGKRRYAPGP